MDNKPSRVAAIYRSCIPYFWVVLVVTAFLTGISASRGIHLLSSINTNLSALLPDSYASVQVAKEIKDKFSKKQRGNNLVMVVDSPSREANEKAVKDIAAYLSKMPDVVDVRYLNESYDFSKNHKLLFLELEDLEKIKDRIKRRIQQEKLGGLYIDLGGNDDKKESMNFEDMVDKHAGYLNSVRSPYFANANGTVLYMKIYPRPDKTSLTYYNHFYQELSKYMQNFPLAQYGQGINISYAGSILTKVNEYNSLIKDLSKAGIFSFIGIALVIIFYFRRPVSVFLVFVPLATGLLQGFAFCSLFIKDLNVVTSFLFSILCGMGVDVGIHMMDRYLDDRYHGISREDALVKVFTRTGKASTTSVLTTCASFFILVINDFKGFSEFGFIAGVGLLVVLLNYVIFFPPLLLFAEKIKFLNIKKGHKTSTHKFFSTRPDFPGYTKVLAGGLLLFALSLFFMTKIGFEWNYGILKFKDEKTLTARDKMREVSGRVNSPAGLVIHSEEEAQAIKEEIKKRKEANPNTTLDSFRSVYDLNPDHQDEKIALLKEIDTLLSDDALNVIKGKKKEALDEFRKSIATTQKIKPEDVPEELTEAYKSDVPGDTSQLAFIFPKSNLELDDGRNAVQFFNEVNEFKINDKTYHASSDSIIFAHVLITMFAATKEAMLMSIAALIILLYIDFRNIKKALIVFSMVAFGLVSMVATAAVLGLRFNFFNMITLPTVLGMGEDNCVHIYTRFEENHKTSVMKALSTSGVISFLASLTTILGYGGLMFAHHPGLRSIGQFAVIGMSTCMLTSLVFYPALLEYLKRKNKA